MLLLLPWVSFSNSRGQFPILQLSAALPAADVKRYMDPKNCIVYTITERSDGTFETKSTFSEMPEWNQTSCIKVRTWSEMIITSLPVTIL